MVKLVKTETGEFKIYFTMCTPSEAREALIDKMWEMSTGASTRNFWWRATTNKKEAEICGEIKSQNHADGSYEKGLSVAEGVSYFFLNDTYTYIYPVTGEVIGTGSDGEPVLKNAKALSKPAKSPAKKYMKKEEEFNKLPEELEPLMVRMLCGIKAENGTPAENDEIIL